MGLEQPSRRLAAILVADIAGYSALMGADEDGIVAALKAHQAVILPMIAAQGGRVIDTAGDGILAEFQSVVAAVNCAIAIQEAMVERNRAIAPERQMRFRIGINQGDVVFDDARIYGDGINVAARLQALAEPGGICVSGKVMEEVRDRVNAHFRDLGEQALKNIARPVRVFALGTGRAPDEHHAERGPLPSLVVLPFQNMSGDAEQEYFADGVVEDIITALSRFKDFAVIARNSSFVYKGRAVDVRQVAQELGVRYVLEGSVRRAGDRLRISAQLVDGTTAAHIWARNYDGTIGDIFEFQDRITASVVSVVEPQIREAEIARSRRERPNSMEAYDLYLRAQPKHNSQTAEGNAEAVALLSQAVALEPTNPVFLSSAAQVLQQRSTVGWPPLGPDDRERCRDWIERALANAAGDATVLALCGTALVHEIKDYERGLAAIQRAVERNPNNITVMVCAAIAYLHCASIEESIAFSQHAIRLSPTDSSAHWALTAVAHAQMILGDYEEALSWARRSLTVNPHFGCTYWMLIAGNAQLGRIEEARRLLEMFQALEPGVTLARIVAGQPAKDPARMAAILEGLRLAGLPEN